MEDEKGYRWETEYEKTWEAIHEDESGSLQASIDEIMQKAKRRKLLEKISNIRLGMMRHLYLIIDMSEVMSDQDLKPTRLHATIKLLERFVEEYFDQNPISQLGILATRNKRAEKITELGGNPRRHIKTLQSLKDSKCKGEPSLQNSMELAAQTLKHMPSHASREILIILGSLTTCDPGNIDNTIQMLKDCNIRCSIIGLAAEVCVCKKICKQTQGRYNVILDETHYKDLLNQHISPPPATANTASSLIRMGFPHHSLSTVNKEEKPSMCMCHLDSKTSEGFNINGYFCPQCKSKYCELPVECKACGLTLVSAPHLARSYHHLFPLNSFTEILRVTLQGTDNLYCTSCLVLFKDINVYRCPLCVKLFCLDCDLFIHEILHSCPGCSTTRGTIQHEQMETT